MIVSEDGYVTGSIDVSKLDQVEPKSEEARAQLDALKRDYQAGQDQVNADAQRLNEAVVAQSPWLQAETPEDYRDAQGKSTGAPEQGAASLQQMSDSQDEARTTEASGDDLDALRAEAEAKGVKVDNRWGEERLRREVESARSGG